MLAQIPLLKGEPSSKQNRKAPKKSWSARLPPKRLISSLCRMQRYFKQASGRNTSRTNSPAQLSSFVDKALSVAALISLSLLCSTGCKNEHLVRGLESRLHPSVAPAPGGEGEMLYRQKVGFSEQHSHPLKPLVWSPSKLQIKGRLFRCCQLIKLQAERRTSVCLLHAGGLTLESPQPGEGLEAGWKDFSHLAAVMWILDLLGKAGVTPGRSWQSQNHHLAEKPRNLLSLSSSPPPRGQIASVHFIS